MDPVTLATTAVTVLSPYLVKAGEKAFETVGEKSVDSLWQSIKAKFTGKPAAEEAVRDLAVRADDQLYQSTFANQLRKVLEAEPAFAAELERLLNNAQSEGGDTIVNTGSGAIATGGGVAAGEGGVAIKGDVHGNIIAGGAKKKG
jgi:hypothetical protein